MDLDLHLHSTASDGTVPPADVVDHAVAARLDAIALTDHDTVAGVEPAVNALRGRPLEIIPAIEVSSSWQEIEIHVLGYFVDPSDPELVRHTRWAGERREVRIRGMVDRLREQGVAVSYEAVEAVAGADRASLARPHLARALESAGYVGSTSEAFDRYIGNQHPAYIPTRLLSPDRAIELIRESGGIAVWAHPPMDHLDALLPQLVEAGLQGLEVYRPWTPPDKARRLRTSARSADLVVTGGSDWHGPEGGELGQFRVTSDEVSRFLELGGL